MISEEHHNRVVATTPTQPPKRTESRAESRAESRTKPSAGPSASRVADRVARRQPTRRCHHPPARRAVARSRRIGRYIIRYAT